MPHLYTSAYALMKHIYLYKMCFNGTAFMSEMDMKATFFEEL